MNRFKTLPIMPMLATLLLSAAGPVRGITEETIGLAGSAFPGPWGIALSVLAMAAGGWLVYPRRGGTRPGQSRARAAYGLLGLLLAGALGAYWLHERWQDRVLEDLAKLPSTSAGPAIDDRATPVRLLKDLEGDTLDWPVDFPAKALAGRARNTGIEPDAMQADSIQLNLFEDAGYTAVRDRKVMGLVSSIEGGQAWIGHVAGEPDSEVVLVIKGPTLAGTIETGTKSFEIVHVRNGIHAVREIDPAKVPKDLEPAGWGEGAAMESREAAAARAPDSGRSGSEVIDILVGYTPQARILAGGVSGIESRILGAFSRVQQAFLNSEVETRLHVVRMQEVAYREDGSLPNAHQRLATRGDGQLDELLEARDQSGADVIVLFSHDASHCGMAGPPPARRGEPESGAFIVMHDDSEHACLGRNNMLAHAFGHLLGLAHEMDESGPAGSFNDAWGYRVCGVFRDVMSSACQGEPRISYFSNPEIMYLGQPVGVAGTFNAARTLRITTPTVADLRTPAGQGRPPEPPVALRAQSATASSVMLIWTDSATNETGYVVEKSSDDGRWKEIAALASNFGSYVDTTPEPGKARAYRVRAWNAAGFSDYSNRVDVAAGQDDARADLPLDQ